MPRGTCFSANAMCRSLRSADDQRSASGRTVKRHLADHRWEPVRVYTLRERVNGGPLRKVRVIGSLDEALVWIGREDFESRWVLQG